ncbi:MAG: hypothetical protein LBC53_05920 [Spirochaetaceae bacterium]|jgi:hypothetical protein|nr:hypothetical protein [Spirochaetaceae bacterium]
MKLKTRCVFLFGLTACLLSAGCPPKKTPPEAEAQPPALEEAFFQPEYSRPPQVHQIPSQNGLWFDFSGLFPKKIDKPENASLVDFTPWPYARYACGLFPLSEDPLKPSLAVVVNRCGFLAIFAGKAGELLVYPFEENEFFPKYTAIPPFYFKEAVTTILYSDDFFVNVPAAPPSARVFSLSLNKDGISKVEIPAFKAYPPGDWNIETFFPSFDGIWRFKARGKSNGAEAVFYGATSFYDQAEFTEETTAERFYGARSLAGLENLPVLITGLLDYARSSGALTVEENINVRLTSPSYGGTMEFLNGGGNENDFKLFAFLNGKEAKTDAACLLASEQALKDGLFKNAFVLFYDKDGNIKKQILPLLPESFFWTSVAIVKDKLIVLWEERESWNIGAAGLAAFTLNE